MARQALLQGVGNGADLGMERWLVHSWQRCLAHGLRPEQRVGFDVIPTPTRKRVIEANSHLVHVARPILERLARAIANTRYFAILTNDEGVVIDAHGPIDHSDRRAHLITRVGADLSERSVGTTAIGAALTELAPVWLHRGEHFFDDTSVYSCAGAPLLGPDGQCVGMLDLTGIHAVERPELKHLVAQSARSIENALTLARPHRLLVRLNWPGHSLGDDSDGLLCLDEDGWVTGSNGPARHMMSQLNSGSAPVHCSELFAQPWEQLFDAARRELTGGVMEVPMWSGLRLQALALEPGSKRTTTRPVTPTPPRALRDVEDALIRKAVDEAHGNVALAAKALGISRATVYRKIGVNQRRAPPRPT